MNQRQKKMRQFMPYLLSVMLLVGLFLGLAPMGSAEAAAVAINKSVATIEKDATLQLSLNNASGKITWKSSDKEVATVTKEGVVTAESVGTATITATYNKNKYTCKLTVTDSSIHKNESGLNKKYVTLEVGAKLTLKSANGKKVTSWKTASKKVATVSKGVVVAKKVGIVKISAVIGGKTYECSVRVVDTANKKGFTSFTSKYAKTSYDYAIATGDTSALSDKQKSNLVYYGHDLESLVTVLTKQGLTNNKFSIVIKNDEISRREAFDLFYSIVPAGGMTYNTSGLGEGYTRYDITIKGNLADDQTKAENVVKKLKLNGLSDFEKLKEIHDWIILNTAYDYNNYLNGTIPQKSYDAAGVFDAGTAVCDGYSKAFMLMARACGFECYKVSGYGNGGDHAWNVVKLDGNWYWVDVTWDDPVPDKPGVLLYDNFMVTDDTLRSIGHSWNSSIKCTDDSYEGRAAILEYMDYYCETEAEIRAALKSQIDAGKGDLFVLYKKNGVVDENKIFSACRSLIGSVYFYSPIELADGYWLIELIN